MCKRLRKGLQKYKQFLQSKKKYLYLHIILLLYGLS